MAHSPFTGPAAALRRRWSQLALLVVGLLLLAGCAAAPDAASDAAAGEPGVGAPAEAEVGEDAGGGAFDGAGDGAGQGTGAEDGGGGSAGAGVLVPEGQGRQVVTSSIDVAVEDVQAAARQVRDRAVTAGGFVAGERTSGGEQPRAQITLRVPVDATVDVMAGVAALGEEVTRTTDAEDVETRLVDLDSRTATQRAGVARVRALLAQAESLEDVLALEAELTRRQADLDSLVQQQAALADRAALATVTVTLTTPADARLPSEPLPPFLEGLSSGWEALVASTAVVFVVVGALLPFAVVALAVGGAVLAVLRATRRARRRAVEQPAPAREPAEQAAAGAVPAGRAQN